MKYFIIFMFGLINAPAQAFDGYPLSRSSIVEGYTAWFNSWDLDRDGKMDRTEWSKSIEATFPKNPPAEDRGDNYSEMRANVLSEFDKDDLNRNEYLSLEEVLHSPLKSFECLDLDRNGEASRSEVLDAMDRCAGL